MNMILSNTMMADEIFIEQRDKKFHHEGKIVLTNDVIHAKVGDVLHFINLDPFIHNIYSFSDALFFDSGAQKPQSQGGKEFIVTLKQAGEIEISCAIHPAMRLMIEVSK